MRPNKWHKLCVDRPALVMLGSFLVAILLTMGALTNFPSLAQGGFEARDSVIQERIDAMYMLELQTGGGDGNAYVYFEANNGNALAEENLKRICKFETAIFNHEGYKELCNKEESGAEWAARPCAGMSSIVPLVFEMDTSDCTVLTIGDMSYGSQRCITTCTLKADWQTQLQRLYDPKPVENITQLYNTYTAYRTIWVGREFTPLKSRYVRSILNTHNYDKLVSEIMNPVAESQGTIATSSPVRAYFRDEKAFLGQMLSDMRLVMASIALVFFYMWYNTQSVFLTVCGLFEIIISFPVAFFFWGVIMGQDYFNILQMLVLFIILGIGADDIFVLQDAWRQSAVQKPSVSGSKVTRFAWAYHRASTAMAVTTVTTFMAFVAAALTPVPSIRAMGIFTAFVVLFDYLLVITWFAACLMFHDKYFLNKSLQESVRAMACCMKGSAEVQGSAEVHDDGGDEAAAGQRQQEQPLFHQSKCCCCIPAPCCAGAGAETQTHSDEGMNHEALRPVERAFFRLASVLRDRSKWLLVGFALLGVTAAVMTFTMLKPAEELQGMFPDDHPISRLGHIRQKEFGSNRDDRKIQVQVVWGLDVNRPVNRGARASQILPGSVDSDNEDESGETKDLNVNGFPVFDQSFVSDTGQVRLQEQMVRFCELAPTFSSFTGEGADAALLRGGLVAWNQYRAGMGGVIVDASAMDAARVADATAGGSGFESYCVMARLRDFVKNQSAARIAAGVPCATWPCANGHALVQALTDGNFSQYLQKQEESLGVTRFGRVGWYRPNGFSGYQIHTDAAYGVYVQAAWAAFNSTIPVRSQVPVSEIRLWHQAWEDLVTASGVDAFATSPRLWGWMALVDVLLKSSIEGISISLVLAYVVLIIATTNVIVATMAITSIIGIMLCVFMTMVMMGMKISVLESVSMIIVVGMSVDYTVHLMHSYHESSEPTRFARARLAMTEMGVSVFGGALTTFFAACPLFLAQFVFFSQFGTFIGMITGYSILWAIFFLMTLAATAGPETQADGHLYGEIKFCKKKNRKDGEGDNRRKESKPLNSAPLQNGAPVAGKAVELTTEPEDKQSEEEEVAESGVQSHVV